MQSLFFKLKTSKSISKTLTLTTSRYNENYTPVPTPPAEFGMAEPSRLRPPASSSGSASRTTSETASSETPDLLRHVPKSAPNYSPSMTYTQRSRPNIVRNANINSGTAGSNSARPPQHVNPALPDPVIFDPNQEYNFCDDDVDKPRMVSIPVVKSTQLSTKLSTAVNSCCHRPKKTDKKSSKLACMPLPRIGTSKKQSSDKKTEIKCNKMPSSSCYVKKSGDSDEVYGFTPNWPEDCPLQSRYNLLQLTLFRVSNFHFPYLMFLHRE